VSVPHSQPAITMALERLLTGSPEWKPQLRASDIRFSADAAGRRIVLGGGPFSTVSQFFFFFRSGGRHGHEQLTSCMATQHQTTCVNTTLVVHTIVTALSDADTGVPGSAPAP
jgi:hypothetical protein